MDCQGSCSESSVRGMGRRSCVGPKHSRGTTNAQGTVQHTRLAHRRNQRTALTAQSRQAQQSK